MNAIFYTTLIIASVYTLFSLVSFYFICESYNKLYALAVKVNEKNKFNFRKPQLAMPTLEWRKSKLAVDVLVASYWVWVIVRHFVG